VIAHLRGRVAHRTASDVVVDVQGVGYLVHVAAGERVPPQGETVELHTSLQVREESMTLYGFLDRGSLTLFELLLTSSGVGPKLALAALGTHRPDVLRTAIASGDLASLTAIPGVGKKVAERLVLELKDKVGSVGVGTVDVASGRTAAADPVAVAEVREALVGLGYAAAEIQAALATLGPLDDLATPELLRLALRRLGGAAAEVTR
jgi:holliday junction DNA helicase RuvA